MANSLRDSLSMPANFFAKRYLIAAGAFLALTLPNASQSRGQTLLGTFPLQGAPECIAFNPATDKLYVLSALSQTNQTGTITVIDVLKKAVITTLPFSANPIGLGINPATNKIYAVGIVFSLNYPAGEIGNLTVVDGATDTITTSAPLGTSPGGGVVVNQVTNRIYVGGADGTVKVIDGSTNTVVTSLFVGLSAYVLVNPITNKIYAFSFAGNNLTVIDGATNNVAATITGLNGPATAAIDIVTDKVYVGDLNDNVVTVINGATDAVQGTFAVAPGVNAAFINGIAVNSATNRIYVATSSGAVEVVDGATDTVTGAIPVGNDPEAIAVDPLTNKIYIANYGNPEAPDPSADTTGSVAVIDGATNSVSTLSEGAEPVALVVDPSAERVYVANHGSGNVAVLEGTTNLAAAVTSGSDPIAVAVDPVLNKAYVANEGSNDVTVIDGVTNSTTTIPAGTNPFAVGVDPLTGKAFVANQGSDTVTAIDGHTGATSTISVGKAPRAVAVNPVTGTVYVANSGSSSVTAIDEATGATAIVATGSTPLALAVNLTTNRIYVADQGSNDVTIITGATNSTSSIAVGSSPSAVDVNPVTNQIYVANEGSNDVTVIDGSTGTTSPVAVGTTPVAVVVNPVTNKIYVAAQGSNDVMVIDGTNNTASPVAVGLLPQALAIDVAHNKVYVANSGSDSLSVIDGVSNSASTLSGGTSPVSLAINPITSKIYVADLGDEATVISEQAAQPTPLVTTISPFPGNMTTSLAPTFTFTASSSYAPTAPPIVGVSYQVDTLEGAWLAASGSAPAFTGQTQPLTFGTHILYAYARDLQGDFEDEGGKGIQNSIGSIASYFFCVLPTSTQTALTSDKNPSQVGDVVNFMAAVTPAPPATSTPTGTVDFFDGSAFLSSAVLDSSGHATYATSALAAGTHQIVAKYEGDSAFAGGASAALMQTVNENFAVAANPSTLTITHGQSGTSELTITPAGGADTVAIVFSCIGLPAGSTCTFNPTSVTPGSGPATTTLTIQTARSGAVPAPFDVPALPPVLIFLLAFAAALAVGTTLRDARLTRLRWVPATCLLASLMLVALAIGCGGGSASSSSPPPTSAPTGNFTVTVHATAGSVDKTTTIALTVN